jgi:AraC family transcriptional regulator
MSNKIDYLIKATIINRNRLIRVGWRMLRQFSGATVRRVIDRSDARIAEHAHDWPVLSIFVLGRYLNETEQGKLLIAGPSAIFYRAGAAHSNAIGPVGFEQIEIEFDAAWLGRAPIPATPVSHWLGGHTVLEARKLARLCAFETDERRFRAALRMFLQDAAGQTERAAPSWVHTIQRRLWDDTALRVNALAREVDRHPSWFGAAYRKATGESPRETAARLRVERAAHALRETNHSCAYIALEAGFCDQSHMNRTFQRLLGRAPSEVRTDRNIFRAVI